MGTHIRSKELEQLAPYLRAVRDYPPLSRDEEHALAVRARQGDVRARQKLVHHNLAFVAIVVRRQRHRTARLDDLIQEGNIGLMRAVEKFDPRVGTRFSTYAVWWIRAYVGRYLEGARGMVRSRGGGVAQGDLSLDTREDDGAMSLLEQIEDQGPSPEALYLSAEAKRVLRGALGRLRRRIGELGWDVVHSRLGQDEPRTLEEIGRVWGVSRESVRKIELRTRKLLARHLADADAGDTRRNVA